MTPDNLPARSNYDQAATDAIHEWRLAYESATNALEHAIACGTILLEVQAGVPEGKWGAWCAEHVPEIGFTTVTKFCRLAQHRDLLEPGEFPTIDRAIVESTDPGEIARLRAALGFCHKSEDEIVQALRIGRQTP